MKPQFSLFLAASLFVATSGFAQIATLPYTQDFSTAFAATTGSNVEIYPNITANELAASSRIYYDVANGAMSITPTGSFDGSVAINLNLSAYSSVVLSLNAKSLANGTGSRPTRLSIVTSLDGGATHIDSTMINEFPNADQTAFSAYNYNLPAGANNQASVTLFIKAVTGNGGSGTRARLLIDDLNIAVSAQPQISSSPGALAFTQIVGIPSSAKPIVVTGSNLTGSVALSVSQPFEISASENGSYASSLTLTQSAGTLSETLYVRLNAAAATASVTGVLTAVHNSASSSILTLSGVAVAAEITAPSAFDLSAGSYTFTEWDEDSPIGSYPANMVFWTHNITDPTDAVADQLFYENYNCVYNLTSRSRFQGDNSNGVSMVNTGNAQYENICNPASAVTTELTYGRCGAIVLALNTTNRKDVSVAWTGRTVAQNNRSYSLKLQYKLGGSSLNSDWVDVAGAVYNSGTTGESTPLTTALPAAVENQAVVLVRWIYAYNTGSSSRAQLGLDNVTVSSLPATTTLGQTIENTMLEVYPNPVVGGIVYLNRAASSIQLFDITGKIISSTRNSQMLDVSDLSRGVYIMLVDGTENRRIVIK